jgi:hypothetical protein
MRTESSRKPVRTGPLFTLVVVGTLAAIAAAVAVRMRFGEDIRDTTLSFACWATTCSAPGVAFAGWLMVLTPLIYLGVMLAFYRRSPPYGKAGLILLGAVLFLMAVNFLSGRRGPGLATLIQGPGAEAFITGMSWGMGTLLAALGGAVLLGALQGRRPVKRWIPATAFGALALAMLGAAMVRAQPVVAPDRDLLGPVLTVNDDVLTRTSITERRGCTGILADDAPLDGCLRTREWTFTTSDSDAVIRFSAVMFADNDGAWDAWGDFREKTRPAGVTGDAIVVPEVTSEWLTVAVVSHAGGQAITEEEQSWLRWPAAQLRYSFAQAIGYRLATEPRPSGSVAPKS